MNDIPALNRGSERLVQEGVVPKKICKIEFGVPNEEDIRRLSHIQIVNRELYYPDGHSPYPCGVLDQRMGVSNKVDKCETCGQALQECIGHFGYLKLELPIFHVGYLKNITEILQRVCKHCSHILLDDNEANRYLRRFRRPGLETLQRKGLAKQIADKCKKVSKCMHCQALQGPIRKIGAMRLVHDIFKSKTKEATGALEEFIQDFDEAMQYNKDLKAYINKAQEDMNPIKVLQIFRKISDRDVELLDMDPHVTRPEQLIQTHLLVPPLCIRPSVASDMGTNEDDLTSCMTRIVHLNRMIKDGIRNGHPIETMMEIWDSLSTEAAIFINSEMPGLAPGVKPTKPVRALCQRLKGKYGRFRGNLSGKRVDFSGRTVISPDPNLELWQVAVPELVAKVLTYPEKVNKYNIKRLRKLVLNGTDIHPGANFVTKQRDGQKKFLKFAKKDEMARELEIGDTVERHVCDGDIALFNRQPSLHRLSIMSLRVKVLPYRTFRFNVCDCAPFNADFDGDEMNLHIPQTEEARAEAINLMGVLWNLCTPKNGCPVIACNQDFLTAGYKMSRKDMLFDRAQFCMLMSYMGIEDARIDLPPPCMIKPLELWSGKQLFSLLIKPNKETQVFVNFETKARNYKKDTYMDPDDGYVYFKNSEYLAGNLDKKTLGDGGKNSLFYVLIRNYGAPYAAKCIARVARVTSRWLMNYGFSIGIDDVTPSPEVSAKKMEILNSGFAKCDKKISEFERGELEATAGSSVEATLEGIMNKELSGLRNEAGDMCVANLHPLNAPLIMANSGSKGSTINISQMIACVGQQSVGGARIQNGFMNRTLPHFPLHSRKPDAKGFVSNSFYTGLTPTEFFFHTMGGREGLVDTAVKTAETGYMQRRLMKALEDLSVQYDTTVRNSGGHIIQFRYGDDLLDPIHMEGDDGRPFNLDYTLDHIKHITPAQKHERALSAEELMSIVTEKVGGEPVFECVYGDDLKEIAEQPLFSLQFRKELLKYFADYASRIRKLQNIALEKGDDDREIWTNIVNRTDMITQRQLDIFFEFITEKYRRAITEPGQTVGAIAGQSIGEPGTQMTLKTFHFAGVASMNVTLGVPRIVEIINATRNISTPIIEAALDPIAMSDIPDKVGDKQKFYDRLVEQHARLVKGRIEKTLLGEVADYIREVYDVSKCYIEIKLDHKIINALQLNINESTVKKSILHTPKLGVKEEHVKTEVGGILHIYPLFKEKEKLYYSLQKLKNSLPHIIVSGIPTVGRAVIMKQKDKPMALVIEGAGLLSVMGVRGVYGPKTYTNNVLELADTLGIEVARYKIINEIHMIMSNYGMNVDVRHMKLLADVMTSKGEVLGITRYGIAKMRDSVLMLASFERTTDHLFDAAAHSRKDNVEGVSECIIMGMPIGCGTGIFKLLNQVNIIPREQKQPIFSKFM